MSRLRVVLATTVLVLATPVAAQDMKGMTMPMPAKKPPAKKKAPTEESAIQKSSTGKSGAKPAPPLRSKPAEASAGAMPGMDHAAMPGVSMPPVKSASPTSMPGMPGMDMSGGHAGHDRTAMPGMAMEGVEQTGTALPAGNAPAPTPPTDHYADRLFSASEMNRARSDLTHEQGGQTFYQVMFNLAEFQARQGRDGYRWDGEAWFGGDINRLWVKTEGEGAFREGVESVEIQALYSRAVGPYFNLQAGVRHDFQPSPARNYATIGFEGLAPYMFEVEGALFLSTKGDLLGRLGGYYDQRITQRLILQPRVEFNLAAQDVPEKRLGAGLTDAELGLRLRYEIRRQFAPYIGVSYEAKTGRTADFARAEGKNPTTTSFVAGVRMWF